MKNRILTLVLATCLVALNATGCDSGPSTSGLDSMNAQDRHAALQDAIKGPAGAPTGDFATIKQAFAQEVPNQSIPYSFRGYGVMLVVGNAGAGDHHPYAFWWRMSDSQCGVKQLDTTGVLTQVYTFDMTGATWSDNEVLGDGQSKQIYCSGSPNGMLTPGVYTLYALQSGGYPPIVKGTPAADYFNCSVASFQSSFGTTCYGYGGNDLMESWTPSVSMYGGDGDDKINYRGTSTGTFVRMMGEAGNDCLGPGSANWVNDCGTGTDYITTTSFQSNCELWISNCNW
jgi:hypothetical protein